MTISRRIDGFLVSGVIFSLWAFTNTYLDIVRYGIDQGFYWWFCNLALIGTSYGFLTKHRGWLIGFLSISCFTQVFWVIDNTWRVFSGHNLFGLVEFMYQPGLPLDEFLLSHYHYFTIPATILALAHLAPKKSNALTLICIFNPLIFAVSYFAFPAHQNVNCIHEACFPGLDDWNTPLYSWCFWAGIFLMHLLIGSQIERFFSRFQFSSQLKLSMNRGAVGALVGLVALAAWDTRYKMSLPQFKCTEAAVPGPVQTACRFTLDYEPSVMLLAYQVKNESSVVQTCTTTLRVEGKEITLDTGIRVPALETLKLRAPVPYPNRSVTASVNANCSSLQESARQNASDPK